MTRLAAPSQFDPRAVETVIEVVENANAAASPADEIRALPTTSPLAQRVGAMS